jgi:hypothetical protein
VLLMAGMSFALGSCLGSASAVIASALLGARVVAPV